VRGLLNKVVVVAAGGTGAASGEAGAGASIGGATSCRLAAEGALVVVGDRDLAAAERTVGLIDGAGGKAVAHLFDAVDSGQIEGLMERAVEEFGGLDGMHYNAADQSMDILGKDLTLDLLDLPLDVWNKTIEIGLTGYLLACRAAIPRMLARGGGAIVGTASSAAYVGRPDTLAYAVAKLGMTPVMRHIASRWGREGIRANTIAPGMVPGQRMLDNMSESESTRLMSIHRSPRLGTADDIAAMVAFLISDDGAWVNGQSLSVDGGLTMRP
jgi:NAD(P)-dependent dehydrogenase (short-subunit alcohol dehydrogenase family)